MKKTITLAVTEFALPAPRRGSIDIYSGFGRGAEVGLILHQQVQELRAKTFKNYKPEVEITQKFERGDYIFEISGRMDGFFDLEQPKVEEIKSTFNIYELSKKLQEGFNSHPYCLQVRTYGYFVYLQNKIVPDLSIHLISSRNGDTQDFKLKLDLKSYETWLDLRLLELVEEAKLAEKRVARRKKSAEKFVFPFATPREGQVELIQSIEEGMKEDRPMLIQAPTGLGKTIGVLYPTLQEALGRGQKVIYITPKNSQHAVAEDAISRLQESGANIKAMTLTAKSKMCFKNEPLCNPEYCEFAKDHYTKVANGKLLEKLAKKKKLTAKTFSSLAEEHQVCPFELQLDAAKDVDAVICDYNYVFAPRTGFGKISSPGLGEKGKPNLVIDEAHNLPSRTMDYYSPSLSSVALLKIREDLDAIYEKFRKEAKKLCDEAIGVINRCAPPQAIKAGKPCKIVAPVREFMEMDEALRAFLSTYLNSDVEIQPKDPVMRLCFYWGEFTGALEFVSTNRQEFFTTYNPSPASVKITCCDASEMLKHIYDEYAQVVGFSATLKPFDFYSRLSGLSSKNLKTAEFVSPFPKANRKILVIPQISSKYSDRERSYPRVAEAIHKISSLKRGNYFAFFPSFDFMEKVLRQFVAPEGFDILKQERFMRRGDIDNFMDALKEPGGAHLLFAVQGGVFSEGVDYPGEMAIGAFVVGPPLPMFDLEREQMKEYYENNYSAGFDYAYTYPAMAKAVQSAGRVIRSETDKGIIVLMDNRFIQPNYAKSMPQDWFIDDPRELTSTGIINDIKEFWTPAEIF